MPAPTLGSLSPASAVSGSIGFTLTVNGANFDISAVVSWGATVLTTTFVSATQVTASVPASLIRYPGAVLITVATTAGSSAALSYLITSPYDLTTVSAIKSWLSSQGTPSTSTTDDGNIQACISSAGVEWLLRTGRSNADASLPPSSPFLAPVSFTEWYDGNGSSRLFLRQQPIVSVQLLQINGVSMTPSSGFGSAGYAIHQDGKSLILRQGGGSNSPSTSIYFGGLCFQKGLQNVLAGYTSGFAAVPPDVALRCIQMVAVNYRRRSWIDQKSQAMAEGAGTITYRDWELPPEVLCTMRAYTRTALA